MSPGRIVPALLALPLMAWVGWTIVQATRADALAPTDPMAALGIDPDHPQALLRVAREHLRQQRYDAATETARHLLAVEPGQGDAFAVLALAAVGRKEANADALVDIALQRAPRSLAVRTQAMVAALTEGDQEEGMRQLDAMLRLSPRRGAVLFPAMAQQTMVPAFEEALIEVLAKAPPWKRDFMKVLAQEGHADAMDRVYADLRERRLLDDVELGRWIDRRMGDGRWRDAHALWLGTLEGARTPLSAVYNGGFEADPTSRGFDWRRTSGAGVFTSFEAVPGATGARAAHFRFIGRPAAKGNLRQALLLAPGKYRLQLRARAEFLHSEQGLEWQVRCEGGPVIAKLGPIEGSFEWTPMDVTFDVPRDRCPGQWLHLSNPAVRGSAQQVTGDLWTDDVEIVRWQ